jgi:hypothetical protein
VQACLSDSGKEEIRPRRAPKDLAPRSRGNTRGKQGGCRAVDRAGAAAGQHDGLFRRAALKVRDTISEFLDDPRIVGATSFTDLPGSCCMDFMSPKIVDVPLLFRISERVKAA